MLCRGFKVLNVFRVVLNISLLVAFITVVYLAYNKFRNSFDNNLTEQFGVGIIMSASMMIIYQN